VIRIGINALYLIPGGVGGTEIYLRSLLDGLAQLDTGDQYTVFANRECGTDLSPAGFRTVVMPVDGKNRAARIVAEQTDLPIRARSVGIDILFNAGFTAPVVAPCPQVTVFHDLQHKRHPEHFRRFDLPAWRMMLWLAARRSEMLVAVSQATAADLRRYYGLSERTIRVIPHGVDERFRAIARARQGQTSQRFVLCVSTLHPHKNIHRLLRVFAKLKLSKPEFRLVLAGMRGFAAAEVERSIDELGLRDTVLVTGWIPREQLYRLYRDAWAFVYPSTFEGFGMPVLEALAAGIPVACSSIDRDGCRPRAGWLVAISHVRNSAHSGSRC
jgi:glycosyltransferase involved in cell wall biosynthesis